MSKPPGGKRRSIFGLPSFTHIHPEPRSDHDNSTSHSAKHRDHHHFKTTLRKRNAPTLVTNLEAPEIEDAQDEDGLTPSRVNSQTSPSPLPSPSRARPVLNPRPGQNRPVSSVFGSLRSFRSIHEDEAPPPQPPTTITTTSSKSPSLNWPDMELVNSQPKLVLHHGEVQTSSSMFRKKKEYLALTETHILRYKSQAKASESLSG